jgi:hypothetical protein
MTHLKTNAILAVTRRGSAVGDLTSLKALVLPASAEIVAINDVPAGKAFSVFFADVVDVREQDVLTSNTKSYRVVGVSQYETPIGAHTEVVAEGKWGT